MYHRKNIGCALIFVQPTGRDLPLEEFAQQVFTRLCITKWQGYSGSQSNDIVFGGDAAGIEVSVGGEDADGQYAFLVVLKPKVAFGDSDYLVEHARNLAKHWSHSGWHCFVPREGLFEITNYEDGYVFAA
jgi:hypothetical protein